LGKTNASNLEGPTVFRAGQVKRAVKSMADGVGTAGRFVLNGHSAMCKGEATICKSRSSSVVLGGAWRKLERLGGRRLYSKRRLKQW
jgi:hypothetical protein